MLKNLTASFREAKVNTSLELALTVRFQVIFVFFLVDVFIVFLDAIFNLALITEAKELKLTAEEGVLICMEDHSSCAVFAAVEASNEESQSRNLINIHLVYEIVNFWPRIFKELLLLFLYRLVGFNIESGSPFVFQGGHVINLTVPIQIKSVLPQFETRNSSQSC